MKTAMTLAILYKLSALEGEEGVNARRVLLQTDWFARMAEFDPRSGEAMTQSLTPFLRKVAADARLDVRWKIRDRLSRIVDHCRFALQHVIKALNENPKREHAEMPIRDVRELDAACFMKLSNRPGRTIREKLASKPYLQAVRRFQSLDLPENRLVKAFATRLVELLRERAECIGAWLQEVPDDLVEELERWLRSDEAQAISRWDNTTPNNTLLSHRDYRRIYDAWRWMQSLDDDISSDLKHLEERQACIDFWQYVADLRFKKKVIIAETPVGFSFDSFVIESWLAGRIWLYDDMGHHELQVGASLDHELPDRPEDNELPVVDVPACIDFTTGTVAFSTGGQIERLAANFSYQQWEGREGRVDVSLFEASAVYKGDGVITIDSSDFFISPDAIISHAYEAAVSIARDLRRVFRNNSLTWLVPDIVNDFKLTPLRQGINDVYADAEYVPRSIAAVFQLVHASDIRKDGFAVAVVDRTGSKVFVTKLVARYDGKLKKVLPETRGYAWERQFVESVDSGQAKNNYSHYDYVAEAGQWHFAKNPVPKLRCSDESLRKLVGSFDISIFVDAPPLLGGYRLRALESKTQGIPLWYDQLPELSTKIPINGIFDYFYFVEKKNAKVSPQRGVQIDIPVDMVQPFRLDPGKPKYEFPLYMGRGKQALQYVASLKSSAFPLKKELGCSLKMTFTYGESQPYNLTFVPLDSTLKPMTVIWEPRDVKVADIANLPVPEFPDKDDWNSLSAMKSPRSDMGLMVHVADAFDDILAYISGAKDDELISVRRQKLDTKISSVKQKRQGVIDKITDVRKQIMDLEDSWKSGVVNSYVLRDKNDVPYCFVSCEHANVFCHSSHWADDISPESVSRGDQVWIFRRLDYKTNKFSGLWMSKSSNRPLELTGRIENERNYLARLENEVKSYDKQISSYEAQGSSTSKADIQDQIQCKVDSLVKSCRVPVRRIWMNGRSFRDDAAPEWFRKRMGALLQRFEVAFCDSTIPPQLKGLIAEMLYPIHKDIPPSLVAADQRDIIEHGISAISVRHIGYALGDASVAWQQQLLKWMLEKVPEHFPLLRSFSTALWRSECLIYRMDAEKCRILCSTLRKSIKRIIGKIEKETSDSAQKDDNINDRLYIDIASARYNFEVMLALMRMRKSSDIEVARMFVPGSRFSTSLLDLVDSFTKVLASHRLTLPSRISLNIDKPDRFAMIPDLLYWLRLLLSGDDGANTIAINEVSDEEDERIAGNR